MTFNSLSFVIFFAVFLWFYTFHRTDKNSLILLNIANIVFYSFISPIMVIYLYVWIIFTYIFSKLKSTNLFIFYIITAILHIFLYKILDLYNVKYSPIIPIGISFFVLQGLGYIIDVKNHKLSPVCFMKLSAFIGFFPTITSGPILKYDDWENNKTEKNKIKFNLALSYIFLGFLYKIFFANIFFSITQEGFNNPESQSGLLSLTAMYSYTMQIYTDFAGYSFMALGIAMLMGFNITNNFNQPYLAQNISDFWRRWHISLSNFLKQYLYIELLGGNRFGLFRKNFNAFITMVICGLWHGITLPYIIWGLLNAIALTINNTFKSTSYSFKINKFTKILITFNFISLCWIFFRSNNIKDAYYFIMSIFSNNYQYNPIYILYLMLCIICYIIHIYENRVIIFIEKLLSRTLGFLTFIFFVITILLLSPSGVSPFIYFNY